MTYTFTLKDKIQHYYNKYRNDDNFDEIIKEKIKYIVSVIKKKHEDLSKEEEEKRKLFKDKFDLNVDKLVGNEIHYYDYFVSHLYTHISNNTDYPENIFNHIVNSAAYFLESLKSEHINHLEKFSTLYKNGIDTANYNNLYLTFCINFISDFLYISKDLIEWWLFEKVDKIYYNSDKDYINVENAKDFILHSIKI